MGISVYRDLACQQGRPDCGLVGISHDIKTGAQHVYGSFGDLDQKGLSEILCYLEISFTCQLDLPGMAGKAGRIS